MLSKHAEDTDWVVLPSRASGYPPCSLPELRSRLETMKGNPDYRLILQNRELFLFRRTP